MYNLIFLFPRVSCSRGSSDGSWPQAPAAPRPSQGSEPGFCCLCRSILGRDGRENTLVKVLRVREDRQGPLARGRAVLDKDKAL